MRTIRLTITALVLSVSSLALGNAAQAHGHTGKPAYSVHSQQQRHYYAPRYPSRPHVYGHDYYQYGHHGIYKKHKKRTGNETEDEKYKDSFNYLVFVFANRHFSWGYFTEGKKKNRKRHT